MNRSMKSSKMKRRHCTLLFLSVWAIDQVSCNPVIQPLTDRAGSSFDFIPLSGPENHERENFNAIAEPLSLFPLSAGGAKDDRNRDDVHIPTSPGRLTGGYRGEEYPQTVSANCKQSAHDQLLSLFPLAPGGARAERDRDWNTIAKEGDVPNSPGPIIFGQHHADEYLQDHFAHNEQQSTSEEPPRVAIIAPGEGSNSRKRVREILPEEDHVLTRPRLSGPYNDGHDQDLSATDLEQSTLSIPSPSFRSSTTRFGKPRLNLPNLEENHEEPGPVSENDLQTASRMNMIAETPPIESKKTTSNPQSGTSLAPIKTDARDTPQPVAIITPEERTDSQKQARESFSAESHALNRLIYSGPDHNRRTPVSRKTLQTTAPMDMIPERPPVSDDGTPERTLEWEPPKMCGKAKLAAHFMAIHFQQAITDETTEGRDLGKDPAGMAQPVARGKGDYKRYFN
ncbi:hypothetical protein PtB15_13B515 [Puccinia triticina]|nr:hypothetical protein PtB15_13B515 [Puccinia triticina]